MKWRRLPALAVFGLLVCGPASAQPVDLPIPPATTTEFPAGISVRQLPGGPVYVDARGHTLYGMDLRVLARSGPDPAQYCTDECTKEWEPVLAPPASQPNIAFPAGFSRRIQQALLTGKQFRPGGGSSGRPAGTPQSGDKPDGPKFFSNPQEAPDWTIIAGPQGPQWVYKGWHMVFTRKGERPGSTQYEGAQDLTWNTLKFVPPVPALVAPHMVTPIWVEGRYALADSEGRLLFTGKCTRDCTDWVPLAGGMASAGTGNWKIDRSGDTPQWTYRNKAVFVSDATAPEKLPKGSKLLTP